jgi:phage terminase large subunit
MSEVHLEIDYKPREAFKPFHARSQRWAALVCHRRAGKTVACVGELVGRAVATPKQNARYAYIAPYYSQAKQVAWDYLKRMVAPLGAEARESELAVILPDNGAVIRLFGADNPDALRGIYFDGVVLDEYADTKPSLWGAVIRPLLADRKGWAVFIGTPKGRNASTRSSIMPARAMTGST